MVNRYWSGVNMQLKTATIPCTGDMDTGEVRLEWCCGDECYDDLMNEPSTDLYLVQNV